MIGRSVDQIRTSEQVNATIATCNDLKLDGLVIIGGSLFTFCHNLILRGFRLSIYLFIYIIHLLLIEGATSNSDAAQLAETFAECNCSTKVQCCFLSLRISFWRS